MLQDIRENMRGVTIFIVGLIIIPFAFVGIETMFYSGSAVETAVSVDGEAITKYEIDRAVEMQKARILEQLKDIDPALLDSERLRGPVVERLIREKALEQAAQSRGMGVSSATIAEILQSAPAFQSNGRFDRERFEFGIRQMGFTPASYRTFLNGQLLINQFANGVAATGFTTTPELEALTAAIEQTRNFYYLTVPLAAVLETIELSLEQIEAYYAENQAAFQTEETVQLDYIELRIEDLLSEVSVDETMLREQFDAEVAATEVAKRLHVAHILIEKKSDGSHQKVLSDIQEQLAADADFADLARRYSVDLGSSEQGGDLGFVSPGTFPDAFEAAVKQLQVGAVSAPVETDSGFHLVKLLAQEAGKPAVFDEQKERLEREVRMRLATELFPAKLEMLKDQTYNVEQLQDVEGGLGLPVKTSQPFTRSGGEGIAAYPDVVRAAFSDGVLQQRYTSEALELGDGHVVVVKLRKHTPVATLPLEQVRERIVDVLKKTRGQVLLAAQAQDLAQQVRSGKSVEEVARLAQLEWQVSLDTPRFGDANPEITNKIFAVPARASLPVIEVFPVDSGDYIVAAVTAIKPGELTSLAPTQRANLQSSWASSSAAREYQGYESALLEDVDIERQD